MKDLYKGLWISPSASGAEVAAAIQVHPDAALKACARKILLTDARSQYDQVHSQLIRIGQLRANMGLNRTELWRRSNADDFNVRPRGHGSQLQRLRDSVGRSAMSRALNWARLSPKWRKKLLGALILALWFWFLIWRQLPTSEAPAVVEGPGPLAGVLSRTEILERQAQESKAVPATDLPEWDVTDENPIVPHPLPRTGALAQECRFRSDRPELRIRSGSDAGHFFVKLLATDSGRVVCRAFVRDGETARLSLPGGEYTVRYASGKNWYGEADLFGDNTSRFEGDDPIQLQVIRLPDGIQFTSGELTLEKQINGNFSDHHLEASAF